MVEHSNEFHLSVEMPTVGEVQAHAAMIAWSSNRYAQDAWPFKVIDCHGGGDDRRQASDGHSEYETAYPILSGSSKGDNVGDPAPFAHKPRAWLQRDRLRGWASWISGSGSPT
jgi:hypothetical protein